MWPAVVIDDILERVEELKACSSCGTTWVDNLVEAKEAVRVDKKLCVVVVDSDLGNV